MLQWVAHVANNNFIVFHLVFAERFWLRTARMDGRIFRHLLSFSSSFWESVLSEHRLRFAYVRYVTMHLLCLCDPFFPTRCLRRHQDKVKVEGFCFNISYPLVPYPHTYIALYSRTPKLPVTHTHPQKQEIVVHPS